MVLNLLTVSTLHAPAASCLPTKCSMAEARASSLLGGYDEEFVNEVEDELECAICQLPLNEPILTKCGHRFCRRCLDEHFRRLAFLLAIIMHGDYIRQP